MLATRAWGTARHCGWLAAAAPHAPTPPTPTPRRPCSSNRGGGAAAATAPGASGKAAARAAAGAAAAAEAAAEAEEAPRRNQRQEPAMAAEPGSPSSSSSTSTSTSTSSSRPPPGASGGSGRPPRGATFRFRHFTLEHGRCAHRMGTDAMLLGAWAAPPDGAQLVLDVGTGSGVLALMAAQRTQRSSAAVHAIDVDEASVRQAADNAAASPWAPRLLVTRASLQDWAATSGARYDLIVCNPPFFVASTKPAACASRAAARHADVLLPFGDLAAGARALLAPRGGRLCVVLPAAEARLFASEAARRGLQLTRLAHVFTKCSDAEPKRHLMQFEVAAAAGAAPAAPAAERLVVRVRVPGAVDPAGGAVHEYSEQYRRMTDDFHHPSAFAPGAGGGGGGGGGG